MTLALPAAFYDRVRSIDLLGPTLSSAEVAGCEALTATCSHWPLSHAAYALATAYHETAGTMQPIKELGGADYFRRLYDVTGKDPERARAHGNIHAGDGARYCGRGYVQLTWQANYLKAQIEIGVGLVDDPDLAMVPDVAAKILEAGMREGWFTGKRLSDYLWTDIGTRDQFAAARRVINGTDKADKIAEHALDFQEALRAGCWS
jgi:putative chitinase